MEHGAVVWAELRVHHCELVVGETHVVLALHRKVGQFNKGSKDVLPSVLRANLYLRETLPTEFKEYDESNLK